MRHSATPLLLAAIVLLTTLPALAQPGTGQAITTTTLATNAYDNGSVMGDCAAAPLFRFNGTEIGCGAGFMLGLSSTNVIGRAYNRPAADSPSGWTPGTIGASTVFPYPTLTSGVKTTFSSAANNVSVEGNHYYSNVNPDYIVHQYKITNTGAAALTDVYPGFYADYDVAGASAAANLGGYDATTQTLYTYFNAANPYAGVTALTGAVSGYKYFVNYPAAPATEEDGAELYAALTTTEGPTGPANDIRGPLGVGPITIPAGGTVTVAFATVAGTDLADLLANAADARSLTTGPVPITSANITTATIQTRIWNNGIIGGDCNPPFVGFIVSGEEELCGAGFLMGLSASNVVGDGYLPTTETGWIPLAPPSASTVFPYAGLTQGQRALFASTTDNLSVELNAYTGTANPDYVVFRYDVTNTGTTPLAAGYPGIFADWDVGGDVYAENLAAVDPASATMYAYDPTGTTQNYLGVTSLRRPLTGWRYDMPYAPGGANTPQEDAELYNGLTIAGPLVGDATFGDQRHVLGTGPVAIPAGATLTVEFAFVTGVGLADFQANVADVRGLIVAGEGTPSASANALSAPRPNPTTGTAELSLTVDQSQTVRVSVYDALGREVSVLLDAPVAAGVAQALRVDARGLPAGLYVVRAVGETFQATQRVVVTR